MYNCIGPWSQPHGPPGPGPVLHYNCIGPCPNHTGHPTLDLYYTIIVQVHVPAIRAARQRQDGGWRQMRGGRFCTKQLQQQQQLSFTDVSNNGTASNKYHSRQQPRFSPRSAVPSDGVMQTNIQKKKNRRRGKHTGKQFIALLT